MSEDLDFICSVAGLQREVHAHELPACTYAWTSADAYAAVPSDPAVPWADTENDVDRSGCRLRTGKKLNSGRAIVSPISRPAAPPKRQ